MASAFGLLPNHISIPAAFFEEAIVSIVATLAKQERIKRSERTKAGLARARSEGRRLGRPKVAVNPADIARLRAQGLSLRAIARQLGIGDGSVRRLLAVAA